MSMLEVKGLPRVLLVEEHQLGAETRALILNQSGFEAVVAYSADIALEMADSLQPDIVILNVSLRDISDIAARIGSRLPSCRIILFSSRTEIVDSLSVLQPERKPLEILSKPIHPQTLLDSLRGLAMPTSRINWSGEIASLRERATRFGEDRRPFRGTSSNYI
jgi:DNA-binding response OmpR family regulator